ncbi:MAG: LysR family transcriptional regulator [Rhodobacterales bacterium]|nr:LysR family transcriptional regulator [Rhodobacterales bacterium]
MADRDLIDARLLKLFDALYDTGSVTAAAERLGLTQPTASLTLGALRHHYGDPLFVRSRNVMRPTPLAEALIGPVRDSLNALHRIAQWELAFDPATAARRFRIAMSDASHITLLPALLREVRRRAPQVALEAVRITERTPDDLRSGALDLALGLVPGLGAEFYQQVLYHQDWVCIVSADHPRLGRGLDIADYRREAHIDIAAGTGHDLLAAALARDGIDRRILLVIPGFLGLAGILSGSDLVATLPRHIGTTLAELARLAVHDCPFAIPTFPVRQHWHARLHGDPANAWLRGVCADLFHDPAGEAPQARKKGKGAG